MSKPQFSFKKFAQSITGKPAMKMEDVLALFGDEAKSEGFDLKSRIEEGIAASQLLNETANEAFPTEVGNENFDFKGRVVSTVQAAAKAVANTAASEQLGEIQTALGKKVSGSELVDAVKAAATGAEVAANARAKFGEQADDDGFDLCASIEGLQAKGGGEHTSTESEKKTGAENSNDEDGYKFENFAHNKELMAEADAADFLSAEKEEKAK